MYATAAAHTHRPESPALSPRCSAPAQPRSTTRPSEGDGSARPRADRSPAPLAQQRQTVLRHGWERRDGCSRAAGKVRPSSWCGVLSPEGIAWNNVVNVALLSCALNCKDLTPGRRARLLRGLMRYPSPRPSGDSAIYFYFPLPIFAARSVVFVLQGLEITPSPGQRRRSEVWEDTRGMVPAPGINPNKSMIFPC